MDFYLCATPYHVLLATMRILSKKKACKICLSANNKESAEVLLDYIDKIEQIEFVDQVYFRRRYRVLEYCFYEKIKDSIYFKRKFNSNQDILINYSWTAYCTFACSYKLMKLSKNTILVEDGANVYLYPKPSSKSLMIKRLYGMQATFLENAKEVNVQKIEKFPSNVREVATKFDINEDLENLTTTDKKILLSVFLSKSDVNKLDMISKEEIDILFTQPFSEIGIMSESEKVDLFKNIILKYKEKNLFVIKKHPRESTQYNFEGVLELPKSFPSELLNILNVSIGSAIGVASSATSNIKAKKKIELDANFFERKKVSDGNN